MSKVEYIVSIKDQNFSSFMKGANDKVNSFESSINGLGGKIAAAFAVGEIIGFAKEVATIGAKFESYEIGLTTLLKSADKAHEVFNNIKADAKATPFDTESLVIANRALISAGASAGQARTDVMNLANAIAATGGTSENLKGMAVNLNQIKSLGKASALDIKQFVFAGIPIYQLLAEATGKNVEEVKKMDVSYDLLSKSLAKAAGAGGMFEGGLEKMAGSTAGQISNLEEAITFFKVDLFEAFKPVINDVISGIANMVQKLVDMVNWGKENIEGLKKVFAPISKFFDPIIKAVNNVINSFKGVGDQASVLKKIFNAIGAVLEFMEPMFGAIGELAAQLISTFVTLGGAVMGFIDKFNKPIAALLTAFRNVFTSIAQAAKDTLQGVGDLIAGILSGDLEQIKKGMKGLGSAFMKANPVSMGYQAGRGLVEGYQAGLNTGDFFQDKKGVRPGNKNGGLVPGSTGASADSLAASGSSGASANKVKGSSPTHVTISINNLIETMSFNTTNLQESTAKIKEEVTKYLLSVVNDANIVAGR